MVRSAGRLGPGNCKEDNGVPTTPRPTGNTTSCVRAWADLCLHRKYTLPCKNRFYFSRGEWRVGWAYQCFLFVFLYTYIFWTKQLKTNQHNIIIHRRRRQTSFCTSKPIFYSICHQFVTYYTSEDSRYPVFSRFCTYLFCFVKIHNY